MKTVKRIARIIKLTVLYTAAIAILGGTAYGAYWLKQHDTVTYEAPKVEAPVQELGDVEQAQKLLTEATAKLDAEEQKLLTEKEQVETEAAQRVAEIEAKIEEINETRSSF